MSGTHHTAARRRPRRQGLSEGDIQNAYRRRRYCLIMIVLCSVVLRRQVNASSTSWTQTNLQCRHFTAYTALSIRGGAVGDDEASTPESSKSWGLGSLFRIADDVKSEASLSEEFVATGKTRPHNNSRGGALTMVKPKPRRFQWLAPLDTSKVAPLSSRLMKDDDAVAAADNTTKAETASASSASAPLNSMWWGNVWEQQLPNQDDNYEEETQPVATIRPLAAIRNETESLTPNVEPEQRKKKTKRSKEKGSSERRKEKKSHPKPAPTAARENESDVLESTRIVQPASEDFIPEIDNEVHQRPVVDLPASMHHEVTPAAPVNTDPSPFVSSGYWASIDRMLSLGYAESHPAWRISRQLRTVRKTAARVTGMHGALSGKGQGQNLTVHSSMDDAHAGSVRRRLAAIHRARTNAGLLVPESAAAAVQGTRLRKKRWGRKHSDLNAQFAFVLEKSRQDEVEEQRRMVRVNEIDRKITAGQKRLQELACEKDVLQRRPNPLWNYTSEEIAEQKQPDATSDSDSPPGVDASRTFNFPPKDLVEDYLDVLFLSNRLVKLNHTDLWKNGGGMDTDDDDDDDELAVPGVSEGDSSSRKRRNGKNAGSWLLRNGLGEKIGETAETAAYKAVCGNVMGVLARSLAAIHGVNILAHSDIRLFMEQAPALPPLSAGIMPGMSGMNDNYAHEALHDAMRRGARKHKKRHRSRSSDDAFIQRDAVVETLLSHCQISAPLLRLFPLAWQRAMLGNVITLITSVVSDFFEGLQFQILGHQLSFSFKPITEEDMIRHLGMFGDGCNRHRPKPEEFEAAVLATAEDMSENLKFLDRWHERAMGSDMLRMQIATLISRLVLTLIDDVLGGARMDLWAAHAGGPRLVAGLEPRTTAHSTN